jgi:L-arabinose isomerase
MVKGKMGVLLIATSRFRVLGSETPEGSYESRKLFETEQLLSSMAGFCEPVCPGPVYTRNELGHAMDLFQKEKADCVFALFLSWSEDFLWVRFLRDMPPVPILFASRIRESIDFSDTEKESDFVEFLSAGGLVGALEASGSVQRFQRPMMETVIGTLPELTARAETFCRAAAVRSRLRNTNFGLMACYNEVMWSTYVDPYALFQEAGPELRFLSVSTLTQEISRIEDSTIARACRMLEERYEILPDVDREKFAASVRASIALENVGRSVGAELVVLNDVDPVLLTEVGLRPGFIPTPEGGDIPVVPEGDIGGGLAVYILRLLSGKPVNFIEPFHIDLPNNCFAGGHAGPNDYTDPAGRVQIARDVRFAKTAYKYAGAPFAWYLIPPGRKTMLHVSQKDGKFQMVCGLVDALPARHFITSYSHGLFRPAEGDMKSFFQKLLDIGVTQHYGVVAGDYTAELAALAKILGFSFTRL